MSGRTTEGVPLDPRGLRLSFEGLYGSYGNLVYAAAMQVLGDHQLAEDSAQETWVSAARALDKGTVPEHPVAWLLTISRRSAMRTLRRAGRPAAPLVSEPSVPRSGGGIEAEEEYRKLHAALSTIPPEDRELLTRRYLEGLPPRTLRKIYGVSRSTMWERIDVARQRLKRAFRIRPAEA